MIVIDERTSNGLAQSLVFDNFQFLDQIWSKLRNFESLNVGFQFLRSEKIKKFPSKLVKIT